jgi:hypothetical protein
MVGQKELHQFRQEIGVAKPLTPPDSRQIHLPSFPPHTALLQAALVRKPIAFIETKKSQTHPEASHLVPMELGKGVESLLEQDSKPNHQVVPFTSFCVNPSYWQQDGAEASGFKVPLT